MTTKSYKTIFFQCRYDLTLQTDSWVISNGFKKLKHESIMTSSWNIHWNVQPLFQQMHTSGNIKCKRQPSKLYGYNKAEPFNQDTEYEVVAQGKDFLIQLAFNLFMLLMHDGANRSMLYMTRADGSSSITTHFGHYGSNRRYNFVLTKWFLLPSIENMFISDFNTIHIIDMVTLVQADHILFVQVYPKCIWCTYEPCIRVWPVQQLNRHPSASQEVKG